MVPTFLVIDATGFEPATSASRTQRSTKLSHASRLLPRVSNLRIRFTNSFATTTTITAFVSSLLHGSQSSEESALRILPLK